MYHFDIRGRRGGGEDVGVGILPCDKLFFSLFCTTNYYLSNFFPIFINLYSY